MADKKEQEKIEAARQLLIKENQKKLEACAKEVNAVLEKYGFTITSGQPSLVPK